MLECEVCIFLNQLQVEEMYTRVCRVYFSKSTTSGGNVH